MIFVGGPLNPLQKDGEFYASGNGAGPGGPVVPGHAGCDGGGAGRGGQRFRGARVDYRGSRFRDGLGQCIAVRSAGKGAGILQASRWSFAV